MSMATKIRIIGARRAYEFRQDDLRLSYLAQPSVIDRMKQVFAFQEANVDRPMPTFGPIPPTLPPGVVFDFGSCELEAGVRVPIRFIHFEARRIVIDVAGPTAVIGPVYERLRAVLREDVMPDGSSVLPDHASIREYSELTVQLPPSVDRLFNRGLMEIVRDVLDAGEPGQNTFIAPAIQFRVQQFDREFPRAVDTHAMLRIEPRAGARPADNDYFSAAPLSTDRHAEVLANLAELIAS